MSFRDRLRTAKGDVDLGGLIAELEERIRALELGVGAYGRQKAGPAVHAIRSIDQTFTTAVEAVIGFDSERYDTDAMHDTVTNNPRLTCKVPGKYLIIGRVQWLANNTGIRALTIQLNATTNIAIESHMADQGGDSRSIVTCVYALAVNDYVELRAYQSSGGNLAVRALANYSPEFSAIWLTP